MEVVETNGETKETEAETGAVTKETGVVTRETGVVVKVETGETSREGGTRETVGGTKDSGTRAPIRDMGYAFKYKVKLEMKFFEMFHYKYECSSVSAVYLGFFHQSFCSVYKFNPFCVLYRNIKFCLHSISIHFYKN